MTSTVRERAEVYMKELQRLPEDAQRAILTMMHGAIVISNMYVANSPPQTERAGA